MSKKITLPFDIGDLLYLTNWPCKWCTSVYELKIESLTYLREENKWHIKAIAIRMPMKSIVWDDFSFDYQKGKFFNILNHTNDRYDHSKILSKRPWDKLNKEIDEIEVKI